VIAARIKNVLPSIIHHNQTGFIKDRYIGETVRSVFDIIELTVEENIPGLMIFIDFEKAFDSLEWNYLLKCLEYVNFGPDFIRWITTFYKNIQNCVINNGMTSDYFTLQRGVRQGDPLSPYLLVVVSKTRNGVTGNGVNGVTRNRVTGFFFSVLFFLFFLSLLILFFCLSSFFVVFSSEKKVDIIGIWWGSGGGDFPAL